MVLLLDGMNSEEDRSYEKMKFKCATVVDLNMFAWKRKKYWFHSDVVRTYIYVTIWFK